MEQERVIRRMKQGRVQPKKVKRALKLGKITIDDANEYLKRIEKNNARQEGVGQLKNTISLLYKKNNYRLEKQRDASKLLRAIRVSSPNVYWDNVELLFGKTDKTVLGRKSDLERLPKER
jgi:hypothetical protein